MLLAHRSDSLSDVASRGSNLSRRLDRRHHSALVNFGSLALEHELAELFLLLPQDLFALSLLLLLNHLQLLDFAFSLLELLLLLALEISVLLLLDFLVFFGSEPLLLPSEPVEVNILSIDIIF